jgi:hypothetical protein
MTGFDALPGSKTRMDVPSMEEDFLEITEPSWSLRSLRKESCRTASFPARVTPLTLPTTTPAWYIFDLDVRPVASEITVS